jgi:hypothetical protein
VIDSELGRTYGALCTAYNCGLIVQRNTSDGTAYRHAACADQPSVLEWARARRERHGAARHVQRWSADRGQELADAGMNQAEAAAPADWKRAAILTIRQLATRPDPFTVDDVIAAVGLPNLPKVNTNNAVGALIRAASARRIIIRVGYTKATRESSHARMVALWQGAAFVQKGK